MLTDKEAREEYHNAYSQGLSFWGAFLAEAEKDLEITLGNQWSPRDKAILTAQNRNAMVFNKTKRITRLISGYQRKNRLAMKIDPVEGSDEQTANQLTGIVMHVMSSCNGYHTMSDAFEKGPLKTGINLINVYPDYITDPLNGDIKIARIPYNKFMLDPYFSDIDLSDCGWLIRREYFPRKQVQALLPMVGNKLAQVPDRSRDDKFQYFRPPIDLAGKQMMAYDEFWKRDFMTAKFLVDRQTGSMEEITGASRERLSMLMKAYPSLTVVKRQKPIVELYILVNGECMWKGEDPYGLGDIPYVAMVGFWEPEYNESDWKLQALVRCIRDPQDETNKRRSKMLDMIDSQISSGWKAEERSVVNPKALYQSGQGQVVWMKDGKFALAEKLETADIPQGLFRLMETLDRDIIDIPGINEEALGQAIGENSIQKISGVLGKLRQGAALTGLQDLFDNYRLTKAEVGRKIVRMVQSCYRPEKVMRIINEQPTPEFYNKDFGKYDCIPQEGVISDTQRQLYYTELIGLKEMGAPVPWTAIIDAAPVQHKNKLRDAISQAEQAQAKEAQFQQLMNRLSAALVQAEAQQNLAGMNEKLTQAMQNRANAALDRIKAMKELGNMDEKQLLEILKIILEIEKMGEQPQEQQVKQGAAQGQAEVKKHTS